jgi:hypothetical protein
MAEMLQIGTGGLAHHWVLVQPVPGQSLEVFKTELLLQLLMRLFAHPTTFNDSYQRSQRRIGRQAGQIVF